MTVQDSFMHQFISVTSASEFSVSEVTFSNITNYLYGDETIGLIQASAIAGPMSLDSLSLSNSTLIYSPAVLVDSVSDLTFTNLSV